MPRIKTLFDVCEKVADQYGNVVGLFLSLVLVAKELTRPSSAPHAAQQREAPARS